MKKLLLLLVLPLLMTYNSYSQSKALVFSIPQVDNGVYLEGYGGGVGFKFPALENTFRVGFNYSKPVDSVDATKLYSIGWVNTQYENEYTACYWVAQYTGGDTDVDDFAGLLGVEVKAFKNVSLAAEYTLVSYNTETSGYTLGKPDVKLLLNVYF